MTAPETEVAYLLKSCASLLWIVTTEERRVENLVTGVAAQRGFQPVLWDCAGGAVDIHGKPLPGAPDTTGAPDAVLGLAAKREKRRIWILRDLDAWLESPTNLRMVKSLARDLQDEADQSRWACIVILTASTEVPLSLRGAAVVLDWPLPTRPQVADILGEHVRAQGDAPVAPEADRERIVDAAVGLAADDISQAFARSIVEHGRIDPGTVAAEKKRTIDRERVLTWYEPDPRGLDAIGGLERMKRELRGLALGLTAEARAYGLQPPRGAFLVGVPGCGKSLTAKAVPAAWGGLPLLRLDLGALKGGLVGQSEGNIRRALKIAEGVAPVVLWLDEIEKGLAGATGYAGDSGVAADQLGTILTWLQEKAGSVFVVATCNDVAGLPPELSRIGRFDATFFVDLPGRSERRQVLAATFGRFPTIAEPPAVTGELLDVTAEFSGAEVAELVPAGMRLAFQAGARPLATQDLLDVAAELIPISKSSAHRIESLRAWGKIHARPASDPEPEPTTTTARAAGVRRIEREA